MAELKQNDGSRGLEINGQLEDLEFPRLSLRDIVAECASTSADILESCYALSVVAGAFAFEVAGKLFRNMGMPIAAQWCADKSSQGASVEMKEQLAARATPRES